MKLRIIGCLVGPAAAMLFGGCATDPYATTDSPRDTYRGAYRTAFTTDAKEERFAVQASEPVFVERRNVLVGTQTRLVPIYRTGDQYFYTEGGRRVTVAGGSTVRRTSSTRALSRAAYRSALRDERPVVSTGYTEEDRTASDAAARSGSTWSNRAIEGGQSDLAPIGERTGTETRR